MGQTTRIEWCDATWNPVTGCYYDCKYCYARRRAELFGGYDANVTAGCSVVTFKDKMGRPYHEVRTGQYKWTKSGKLVDAACPFEFEPTLYEYKLKEPQRWKRPKTIFVCSMADLFGDWVPTEWIEEVFTACEAAPQHRYLFLTKNPARYCALAKAEKLPKKENFWYGSTVTQPGMKWCHSPLSRFNTFISIEPILKPFLPSQLCNFNDRVDWIIVGAMAGAGSEKYLPDAQWIIDISDMVPDVPLFMTNSLLPVVGEKNMRQEFPWRCRF